MRSLRSRLRKKEKKKTETVTCKEKEYCPCLAQKKGQKEKRVDRPPGRTRGVWTSLRHNRGSPSRSGPDESQEVMINKSTGLYPGARPFKVYRARHPTAGTSESDPRSKKLHGGQNAPDEEEPLWARTRWGINTMWGHRKKLNRHLQTPGEITERGEGGGQMIV